MTYEVCRTSQAYDRFELPGLPMPCEEARLVEGRWYVEFKDLLDLAAFVAKYERVVLSPRMIEIYDDWRE